MDKETLSEYGNIVIAAIIACLLLAGITGSFFAGRLASLVDATIPEYEQYEYENYDAFEEYMTTNDVQ